MFEFIRKRNDVAQDFIAVPNMIDVLESNGFLSDDPRWKPCYEQLLRVNKLDEENFTKIFSSKLSLLSKAFWSELIVPDFLDFSKEMKAIYDECRKNKSGAQATYIPQLGLVDPEQFALSVCTIDGQRCHFGEFDQWFCVQSCSKVITYGIALEKHGEAFVHKHVDREPSGQAFNSIILTPDGLPYNPMINSGAIMMSAMVSIKTDPSQRFDAVMDWYKRLSGGFKPAFSNSTYLSERQTADRNFAMAYLMRDAKCFPEGIDIVDVLEFYFQCCSIEMTADSLAVVAATLANGGICPLTGERVFASSVVRACLSLMYSCGMYDYSGQFAFRCGIPAKSGVSGCIMFVIPGVGGICTWSPRLDKFGNSARGVDFATRLVQRFTFHNFDHMANLDNAGKIDPRANKQFSKAAFIARFITAAQEGDVHVLQGLLHGGQGDANVCDYDRRTALHVAASEGQLDVCRWLVEHGAYTAPRDRWNNRPLDDAVREGHPAVAEYLKSLPVVEPPSKLDIVARHQTAA